MLYLLDVSQYYGYLGNPDSHCVIEEDAKRTATKTKKVSCQLIIPNTQHIGAKPSGACPAGVAGIRAMKKCVLRYGEFICGAGWC